MKYIFLTSSYLFTLTCLVTCDTKQRKQCVRVRVRVCLSSWSPYVMCPDINFFILFLSKLFSFTFTSSILFLFPFSVFCLPFHLCFRDIHLTNISYKIYQKVIMRSCNIYKLYGEFMYQSCMRIFSDNMHIEVVFRITL